MYTHTCTALAQSRNWSCAITLSTLLLVTPRGTIAGRSQPQCKMPCYSHPKAAQKPKPQPSPPRVKPVFVECNFRVRPYKRCNIGHSCAAVPYSGSDSSVSRSKIRRQIGLSNPTMCTSMANYRGRASIGLSSCHRVPRGLTFTLPEKYDYKHLCQACYDWLAFALNIAYALWKVSQIQHQKHFVLHTQGVSHNSRII